MKNILKKIKKLFYKCIKHKHKWKRDGDMFLKCYCGAEAVWWGDQCGINKDDVKGYII